MNNEELAASLRTEIQTYLKNTVADLQQEIAEMQDRVGAEIERHRGELEKSFQTLLAKGSEANVSDDFARVVTEHLQIAFEDGSKEAGESAAAEANRRADEAERRLAEIESQRTSDNFAAEQSSAGQSSETVDYKLTRDAINEISAQSSQADILKSLVKYAANFTPRGAFFIVKSDHLVGWRVFGSEITGGDESVREVFLPLNNNTLLGASIRQNAFQQAAPGEYAEDAQYLQKLNFGSPEQMIAIPLVVRGRGVAVLYADAGTKGSHVQTDVLESLVRVASLTVELLANARSSTAKPQTAINNQNAAQEFSKAPTAIEESREFSFASPQPAAGFAPSMQPSGFDAHVIETPKTDRYEDKNGGLSESYAGEGASAQNVFERPSESFSFDASNNFSQRDEQTGALDVSFENYSAPQTDAPSETGFSFETTLPSYSEPTNVEQSQPQTETQNTIEQSAPRRFGERSLELPIDVPEDERRLHNDARRFARLLVSEIKLYNEQKVKEGRQAMDLYSRLRDAIERSREMYDKRVAPPVVSRFDYFHYELINTLAEGDENKLGSSYPGVPN